jgi:hypothetical protein
MFDAFDADGGNGGALNGAEEHTAEGVADSCAETALEGLRGELAEAVGERFGVGNETLRFLEAFEHN